MNIFDTFRACLYCNEPVENFEPGPKGGSSQNMTCRRCGTRYNLAMPSGRAAAVLGPHPRFLEVLGEPVNAVPLSGTTAQRFEREFGIKEWPGYDGVFTRESAPGALPADARVSKIGFEPGDRHPDGTQGTVLGSIATELGLLYFIEWDPMPRVAVAIAAKRVRSDNPRRTRRR